MADPVTWVAIAGVALSAIGTAVAATQQHQASKYNAKVAQNNAILSQQSANENARRHRLQVQKALGSLRANVGASGIDLDGSALDVLGESARVGELDALTIEHAGSVRSTAFGNEAALDLASGRAARTAGLFSASSSLLGGGVQAFDQFSARDALSKQTGGMSTSSMGAP